MEDRILTLSEYLQFCSNFDADPTPANERRIQDFVNQIVVKEYMPLKDKTICLINILHHMRDDYDIAGAAWIVEISKMVDGLFKYCVNFVNDAVDLSTTFQAYDMCQQYGLADHIEQACRKDFGRLCNMIDHAMNISNAYRMIETASLVDGTALEQWIKSMEELKTTIDPELLKELVAISEYNNGSMKELSEALEDTALKDANTQLKANKLKADVLRAEGNNNAQ